MMRTAVCLQLFPVLFVLCFSAVADPEDFSVSPMEKREQEALYLSVQSLVGKGFNWAELYPDPCGWTPIQGVSCDLFDGIWRVTVIAIGPLQENSLQCADTAELSPHLFELKRLKSLAFFDCFHHSTSIHGLQWDNLSNSLEALEFRSNPGLRGEIPTGLGTLRRLQSLVLLGNDLTGELPAALGDLSELKQLVLSGNRLTGRVPPSFGALSQLLILDLSRNLLSGSLPSAIGGLCSLLKLDLSNNSLDGTLPAEIGKLKNITLLDVGNNGFSNGLPQSLQEMVSLEEISASNNPIGGNLTAIDWKNLQNLMIVDFANMGLVGEIPGSMTEMKRLRFLALSDNRLSGNVPPDFENMPSAKALYFNGNDLAGRLQFSVKFYSKMGRYFCVRSNPNLCYNGEDVPRDKAPLGVKECQQ